MWWIWFPQVQSIGHILTSTYVTTVYATTLFLKILPVNFSSSFSLSQLKILPYFGSNSACSGKIMVFPILYMWHRTSKPVAPGQVFKLLPWLQSENIVGWIFSPILRFLQNRNHNNTYKDPVNDSSGNLIPNIVFFVIFWQLVCSKLCCKQVTLEAVFSVLYFSKSQIFKEHRRP